LDLRIDTGYKQILGMAMPISLAILVPQINFITNNIFLGALGERELASAGITGVYYLIFAVIGSGLNNGLQALIARRGGQNLPEEIGRLFFHGVWIALGISSIGIIITYTVSPIILRNVIHDPLISEQVIQFLHIRIWGLPLLALYVTCNALLVGTNQTRFLVWGTLSETLFNIFFDYSLIYGKFGLPQIGFNGAAYASIIAEGAGFLVMFSVISAKGMNRTFGIFDRLKIDFTVSKLILVQSSPLIAQYALSIISWEYFYILIEHHGSQALAISNTMRNIFGLFGVFSWSFASTTNMMVSNIIGQGRTDEVVSLIKRITKISFSISLVFFVLLNSIPHVFLSFYGQGEEFIRAGVPVVRVISVALMLMSFSTVWLNAVTGTANTQVNLMIELVAIVVYCVYVYIVLEIFNMPITWGWLSEWLYWSTMFTLAYFYIRSGRWKNKKI